MKCASLALAVAALMAGLKAAFHWYKASTITPDPGWTLANPEPVVDERKQMAWNAALLNAALKSAALNKVAALWTAVAVALGALANISAILFPN